MLNKEKVALFLPSLRGGGVEKVMLTLAGGFAEKGFAVDLVLVKAEGPYLDQVPPGVNVVDLRAPGTLFALPKLVRYLKRHKPYALLAAMDHANVVALLARKLAKTATKVVVSIHSTLSHSSKHANPLKSRAVLRLASSLYHGADNVIAVSYGVARDFSALTQFPAAKITTVYNPVIDDTLFERASGQTVHPWVKDKTFPVILAVGRLTRAKDFGTLIAAFALARRGVQAKLLILGEGEERPSLERLIRASGVGDDVALAGYSSNPYPYMVRSDVFVLSSRWEGLPTALIEAYALGANIVATDCESGPREILVDGEFGRLVPVGDVAALADALTAALHTPAKNDDGCFDTRFAKGAVIDTYLKAMSL